MQFQGDNANYCSERTMQEMIDALATVPRQKIMQDMQESPFFSLLIDESTDVAVMNQLIIYGQYFLPQSGKVIFHIFSAGIDCCSI